MVRKIVVVMALLLLSFEVLGQEYLLRTKYDTVTTKSERLYLDTAFDFDFDNTEYSGSNLGVSETLFGISLMPVLRFEWNENHNLGFGVNMQKLFGSTHFLDKIDLVAYYQFHNEKYGAVAGLFRRDKLMGRYSEAFFCNAWLANNRVVQGLALQYHDKVGYAELVADWNGLYSTATREQFRILFSGEGRFARYMYAGASVAMHHYANRADFQHNVVDNFTINPYLGVDFSMVVNVEARLGYLQTLQRDRLTGGGISDADGRRVLLQGELSWHIPLEQYLCRQKPPTPLQLGGQGGYDIWHGPLRFGLVLWYDNGYLQPYGHRLRAQLL